MKSCRHDRAPNNLGSQDKVIKFILRSLVPPVVIASSVAYGVFAQNAFRTTNDGTWVVHIVSAAIVAALTMPAVQLYDHIKGKDAVSKYRNGVDETLGPIFQMVLGLAESKESSGKSKSVQMLVPMFLDAACRQLQRTPDYRATYYRYNPAAGRRPARLSYVISRGRAKKARREFIMGTPEGDLLLTKFGDDDGIFVRDLKATPINPSTPARSDDPLGYRTFLSVPVRTNKTLFGMITLDAPKVGDIRETDLTAIFGLARLFASQIEAAIDGNSSKIS